MEQKSQFGHENQFTHKSNDESKIALKIFILTLTWADGKIRCLPKMLIYVSLKFSVSKSHWTYFECLQPRSDVSRFGSSHTAINRRLACSHRTSVSLTQMYSNVYFIVFILLNILITQTTQRVFYCVIVGLVFYFTALIFLLFLVITDVRMNNRFPTLPPGGTTALPVHVNLFI